MGKRHSFYCNYCNVIATDPIKVNKYFEYNQSTSTQMAYWFCRNCGHVPNIYDEVYKL